MTKIYCPYCAERMYFVDGMIRCWYRCHKCGSESPAVESGLTQHERANEVARRRSVDIIHGHWIHRTVETEQGSVPKTFCSNCNRMNGNYTTPYCPHCASKMDLEETYESQSTETTTEKEKE